MGSFLKNYFPKITIMLFSLTLFSCGKNIKYIANNNGSLNKGSTPKIQFLKGSYTDPNTGKSIDLGGLNDKTTVIIFAQDTCQVCSEEAMAYSKYAKEKGLPKNFQLRHLLVESYPEDAIDWKNAHNLSWPVGVVTFNLFTSYCPEKKVPCLLVYKPNEGITFQHTGEVSINQLLKETNGWIN